MKVIKLDGLAETTIARELVGADHGLDITLILVDSAPGGGPRLHKHPYDEIFIVQEGQATFTVGDAEIVAGPGDVLVAEAGEPHRFVNSGDGRLRQVDIHMSPAFSTEWLE